MGEMLLPPSLDPAMRATAPDLLAALAAGKLDWVLILAEEGEPQLVKAMEQGRLELKSVEHLFSPSVREQVPYLRSSRIPQGTYPGQKAPVDTFGGQVVLAAPRPDSGGLGETGGPATALRSSGLPLSMDEVRALDRAAGLQVTPDPLLPSAWSAAAPRRTPEEDRGTLAPTVLNSLVILFLVWLACLVVRRRKER